MILLPLPSRVRDEKGRAPLPVPEEAVPSRGAEGRGGIKRHGRPPLNAPMSPCHGAAPCLRPHCTAPSPPSPSPSEEDDGDSRQLFLSRGLATHPAPGARGAPATPPPGVSACPAGTRCRGRPLLPPRSRARTKAAGENGRLLLRGEARAYLDGFPRECTSSCFH